MEAQVMKYQTNINVKRNESIVCGSEKKLRENRHLRLEGKDYIVRDGDILSI
jgi:ribosome-binding ATPase YchF (GTP1/OBG family)